MNAFKWNKHFITGISTIDKQHEHLVNIINNFGAIIAENNVTYNDIEQIISELLSYTEYHFKDEQEIMAKNKVDKRHIRRHIEKHQSFVKEVIFFSSSLTSENHNEYKELFDYLMHWLAYHILGIDQELGRQITLIKNGSTPEDAYNFDKSRESDITEPLLVALKSLFNQVSDKNDKLMKLNRDLETKVIERTKELARVNEYLEELTFTDQLTGLPNRRFAIQQLSDGWKRSIKNKSNLACIMVDADNFKEVNDNYGHAEGDKVLKTLAMTLKKNIATGDVCRLGGDEFLIVCYNIAPKEIIKQTEIMRKAVEDLKIPTGDGIWQGSVSIGVAFKSENVQQFEDLIKIADINVYEAKRAGKNRVYPLTIPY